jgi:hypothetical protein
MKLRQQKTAKYFNRHVNHQRNYLNSGTLTEVVDHLISTRPPAHEDKLLGAHFFGLMRGKKGAPRVYPWPATRHKGNLSLGLTYY